MEQLQLARGTRALVVVAHPDDETIWMGGTILKHKSARWTILCLCRASDADRAPKFHKVCAHFGARGIMEDLDDEGRWSEARTISETKKIFRDKMDFADYDLVFTHGNNGEYGHPAHIATHKAFLEMARAKKLDKQKLRFFHYQKKFPKQEFSQIIGRKSPDFILNLSPKLFKQKKAVVSEIYGFDPNGPDVGYCTNPECFKKF